MKQHLNRVRSRPKRQQVLLQSWGTSGGLCFPDERLHSADLLALRQCSVRHNMTSDGSQRAMTAVRGVRAMGVCPSGIEGINSD
jgi:hypothetical protein